MKVEEQISTLMKQAEARRLVSDLYNQGMPIKEIAKHVPVCLATVYRWIDLPKRTPVVGKDLDRKGLDEKLLNARACPSSDEAKPENLDLNKVSEIALLKAQIKELKAQLRAQSLKAQAYETMVQLAEERFGIPIRKKSGAKQ
ncbi:helix-turn-helix domain-containing protein, partial [Turicimonas muris]|uniref:helix-turn-helix domain-containing protein n=1 Tax=Turicimonas muris TaxID=1796652 RepID=UPI0025B45283